MTEPVLDLTLTPCAACGQPSKENKMVRCECCDLWFHYRCVGVNTEDKKEKKWFCPEDACHEAFQKWQRGKEAKKTSRTKKTADDSDRSSVISDRASVLTIEQKLKALEEEQKRMDKELEAEFFLKAKELAFNHAMEEKKNKWEKKLRDDEEEAQKIALERELQEKWEQLQRMKASQLAFRTEMASLDKEIGNLRKVVQDKKTVKPLVCDPKKGLSKKRLKNSHTSLRNLDVSTLTTKNLDQLIREEEKSDDDDEDVCWERESAASSESSLERDDKASIASSKQLGNKVSHGGLGKLRFGPTRAQLASRSGITRKLPTFSGKPEEWPLFFGSFKASNEACGYSDIENLVRLQESLKGPALEMVRGQLLLPKSVPRVIAKLRQMYGRPEQLLQSHLDKVRKLESPKMDKLASFVPFGNAVEQLCEHLEAAELTQHLINPLLIQELVDKLPDRDKRDWVRYKRKKGEVTLRTLTDFLVDIVEDACDANVDMEFQSPTGDQGEKGVEREAPYPHSEEKSSSSDESDHRNANLCKVCQRSDHRIWQCQDFKGMSYHDRLEFVTYRKLCSVCLNEHDGTQCRHKIRCNVGECRELHNPLLHKAEGAIGTSVHIRTNQSVLFRMIPVQLYCGGKSVTVLAFLDEGASVTLMEKNLADRLGVVGVQEELTIKWTADITRVEKDSKRMNVLASGVGSGKKLLLETVRTVRKLMLPQQKLNAEELSKKYRHITGLPISSYDGRPEILIGLNNLHAFAPIEAKNGATVEPIAVRCKLGWTVYGMKQTHSQEVDSYLGYHQEVSNSDMQKRHNIPKQSGEVVQKKGMEQSTSGRKVKQPTDTRIHDETSLLRKKNSYQVVSRRQKKLKKPRVVGSKRSPCPAYSVKNCNTTEYAAQCPDAIEAATKRHDVNNIFDAVNITTGQTKERDSTVTGRSDGESIGKKVFANNQPANAMVRGSESEVLEQWNRRRSLDASDGGTAGELEDCWNTIQVCGSEFSGDERSRVTPPFPKKIRMLRAGEC